MNWYKKYSQSYIQKDIENIAKDLIKGAWKTGYAPDDNKYSYHQIKLIIDNEPHLSDLAWSMGEDVYPQIMNEVEKQLISGEEKIFKRREKKLEGTDELRQIREAIKGKSWEQAKREIAYLSPMGKPIGYRLNVCDEDAEEIFQRLYKSAKSGGYLDIEMLKYTSPFFEGEEKILKRLSEIRNKDTHGAGNSNQEHNDYTETQIYHSLFGFNGITPPPTIEVYRGVSRAGAKIRPGDYVTADRDYARSYLRGKKGAIVRETLSTDDLLISKIPYGYGSTEFVYYPRNYIPEKETIESTLTFKEFYGQVNFVNASSFNLLHYSKEFVGLFRK